MTTGNRLTDMEFDEISLVTRPANQLSKVVLFKSDTSTEETMTTELEIETTEDEMSKGGYGKMAMKKKKMKPMAEEDMGEDEMEDEEPMDKGSGMKRRGRAVRKDEGEEEVIDLPQEVYDYVQALEAANAELMEQIEKMAEEEVDFFDAESEDIMKSADPRLIEIIKSAQERAEAAEMIAKAERDFRLEREFISKASTLSHLPIDNDDFGKVLKSVADVVDTETYNKIWQVLEAANANISTGNAFKEIGKSTGFHNDGPSTNVEKAAAKIQSDNPNLSREQAIAKAVENDPSLYINYLREGN
jgi:hypothetical protein